MRPCEKHTIVTLKAILRSKLRLRKGKKISIVSGSTLFHSKIVDKIRVLKE